MALLAGRQMLNVSGSIAWSREHFVAALPAPSCSSSVLLSPVFDRRSSVYGTRNKRSNASSLVVASARHGTSHGKTGDGKPVVRKLILLRHADSDGAAAGVRDHDRSISSKGKKEAAAIAQQLESMGWIPDLVLASNATRTKQTLDEICAVIPQLRDVDAHLYGSLYTVAALDGQTRQHLQECLLEVVDDERNKCVMCVGHNKGWEEAASSMAGRAIKLRTACAALLQCVCRSWEDVLAHHPEEGASSGSEGDPQGKEPPPAWQLVGIITPALP